ncbi:MAG TPA: serine hydrolase domain-containing protein, partial [Candidatus Krumholzibacteria bacterium]|nr:serine hydrolase domain-containing protein [Candidatus Krumholzibacteria bacterium]
VLRANGGIFSTPEDMMRWANALLGGGALPPGSIKKLWTPYVAEGGSSSYGYGWDIRTMANGDTLIGHDGGNGYYGASVLLVPRRHIAMVMMTNVAEDMPLWSGIMESVAARMVTSDAFPVIPDVVTAPASRLREVAGAYRFDAENSIDVAVNENGLRLTPKGQDAFAMAVSTRDVNLDRCRDLSERIVGIVTGLTNSDFNPLYEAYEHRASMETIKSHWDDAMREWTGEHGKLKGFDVIGTAMLRERDMTLVRFNFENGTEDRAYVWDKDAEHKLLGVSGRGLASEVHCLPVKGDGFASWDPRSGDSRPFQLETQDGVRVLRIASGNQTFIARSE